MRQVVPVAFRIYKGSTHVRFAGDAEKMIINGEIAQVMETWPLQLIVNSAAGNCTAGLTLDTRVMRNEREIGPDKLVPGLKVEISGEGQENSMIAQLIRIIE